MSAEGSLFVIRSGTAEKYLNSHPLIQPSPFRKLWRCDIRWTAINEGIVYSTIFLRHFVQRRDLCVPRKAYFAEKR